MVVNLFIVIVFFLFLQPSEGEGSKPSIKVYFQCQNSSEFSRFDNTVKSLDGMSKITESIDIKCKEAINPVVKKCDVVESMIVIFDQKVEKNQEDV